MDNLQVEVATKIMSTISIVSKAEIKDSEPQLTSVLGSASSNPTKNMSQDTEAWKDPAGACSDYQQLSGHVLDRRFVLGTLIRNENHAVVFSVKLLCSDGSILGHSEPLPEHNVTFEARIYDLHNISPELKRYRLRNMKRMASRQVFHQRWQDLEIIVYVLGEINTESYKSDDEEPSCTAQSDTGAIMRGSIQKNHKTNYQRESGRLRQRDKRRAKRRRDHEARAQSEGPVPPPPASSDPSGFPFDHTTLSMVFSINLAFNPRQELRDELLPIHRDMIEAYLQKRSEVPTFQSPSEAVDFISIKKNELVSLQRLNKQLPEFEKGLSHRLEEVSRRLQFFGASAEKRKLQEGVMERNKALLRDINTVQDMLPDLIGGTKVVLALAKQKLVIAHDDLRKRELNNLAIWIKHVIPGSESFNHIVSRLG